MPAFVKPTANVPVGSFAERKVISPRYAGWIGTENTMGSALHASGVFHEKLDSHSPVLARNDCCA
jgi:hypothetical protein